MGEAGDVQVYPPLSMRVATRSSRLRCQSNYLRMFRIVLALAMVVFPAFGLAGWIVDPGQSDPIWMRFVFSMTAATLLAGTYRCPWVRARISGLTSGFLGLISYWYAALAFWSGFSPDAAIVFIVVFAAVGVGVSFWVESLLVVSAYMLSMIVIVGVAIYSVDDPGVNPAAMLLASTGVGLVIYIAVSSRAKADEDIYAQHGLLRSLFDESADAHILFDTPTGCIIDFNQRALDLFEVSDVMLAGRTMDWRTGLRVLDVPGPIQRGAMEQRQRKCRARSGRIFWAEVSMRNLRVDDLEITLLKVIDVTEKRRVAQAAILEARRAAAVAELSAAMARAGADDAEPLEIVARAVTRSHADLCVIAARSAADKTATPVAIAHRNPLTEDTVREWLSAEPIKWGEGLIGKVLATGESLVLEDVDAELCTGPTSQHHDRFVRDAHLNTVVVHPLRAQGDVVGAILFSRDTQKRPFTDHDHAYFNDVAEKAAWSVANARLLGAIARSEARFRSLVQNSSDLILLLDGEARIQYVSPSAERVLGRRPDEMLGVHFLSLAHPRDVAGLLEESNKIRDGKELVVNASRFRHGSGEWRWLEAVAVNMLEDENVRGVVINARDVTERKRQEEELRAARDVAEEMVRMKDAFLANMSHEIRTPLTAILGFSTVLGDELDSEHREFIGHIHSNGTRLMDALNSVLDLARLEAGGVALERSDVDVREAVEEAVAAFRAPAEERGLALNAAFQLNDSVLRLDRSCFDRILTNLVGNALRFTEEGGVHVDVRQSGDEVVMSVEDTGIGIGEEFIPHLFKPFRQESSGFSRSHEGTGLGLAITKRLVEVMGGRIDVESHVGKGSAFRVFFPVATAEQGGPQPTASTTAANEDATDGHGRTPVTAPASRAA